MKKKYMTPITEVAEALFVGQIMTDQSEPEASGWVGGNTGEFEESESSTSEPVFDQNLWDD